MIVEYFKNFFSIMIYITGIIALAEIIYLILSKPFRDVKEQEIKMEIAKNLDKMVDKAIIELKEQDGKKKNK